MALLFLAGCARVPPPRSGAEARARFLEVYAAAPEAARGLGSVTLRRAGERRGGFRARWAAAGESVVVAGYVGPVRALDVALLRDSLYVGLRPYDTGFAGLLPADGPLDSRSARFLANPWAFGDPWIRDLVTRAAVEPSEMGYRLTALLPDERGDVRAALDLAPDGTPRRLRLLRDGAVGEGLVLRYGPPRGYAVGRLPAWIEWAYGTTLVRLEIEDLSRVDRSRVRLPAAGGSGWTLHALDDPKSEAVFRRILGLGETEP